MPTEQDEALPSVNADAPDLFMVTESAPRKSRFWRFWRGAGQQDRLADLNMSIMLYPDSAANYMLRGEWYEQYKQYDLASADFATALRLAGEQVMTDRWGLVNQAVQDRAIRGLWRLEQSE